MVLWCEICKARARDDRSCKTPTCEKFRVPLRGKHWSSGRLQRAVGGISDRIGAFVTGGFALTLLHRHDIRVGIASGMYLRHFVRDAARRMELLAVLYCCYWRWSTKSILLALVPHMDELLRAEPLRRAEILLSAWEVMEQELSQYQVLGSRLERRVELRKRTEVRSLAGKAKDCFAYHPYMNPASRRTGAQEFRILLNDVRSGSLWRACTSLAQEFNGKPTFRGSEQILKAHEIALWSGRSKYNRTLFLRWLFKAEGLHVHVGADDWAILAGMGSGAEHGLDAAGIVSYDTAVSACGELARQSGACGVPPEGARALSETGAAASGAQYGLDDLICFLCLSQHQEAVACSECPRPAPPVSVLDDLGLDLPPDSAVIRRGVMRKTSETQTQASIMASVLPEVLRWLPLAVCCSVAQCCRPFCAGGLFMETRLVELRRNVADSVASLLSLQAPRAVVLQKEGVTKSMLLRTLACAWDLLEKISNWHFDCDEQMMSLALVRLSVKFELKGEHSDIAVKLFGTVDEKAALVATECRLLMALPFFGEIEKCALATTSQPLARRAQCRV
jgi:hypothetical protein